MLGLRSGSGRRWPSERPNESGDPADNSPAEEDIESANRSRVVVPAGESDNRRNEIADDQNYYEHGNLRVAT